MFSKMMQFQKRSVQLTLNLRSYTRNFRSNFVEHFRYYNGGRNSNSNSSSSVKYIFAMSSALTFSALNNVSLNSVLEETKSTKWTEKEIMSEPEAISKALQFGAAFSYGDYGDEVILGGLSNNITFLREIKNLIITGDTSLNEAAYAKQLMEYLNLKSFDSVQVINSAEMSDIYSDNTGVLAVSNNNESYNGMSPFSVVNENTFTSNVTVLSLIAAWFSQLNDENNGNPNNNRQELIAALHKLHTYAGGVIFSTKNTCVDIADFINSKPQPQNIYILGAGFGECIAKEGVSKITEIEANNVNAKTDYVLNEIDEDSAVIMLILDDENSQRMVRNAREIETKTNGKMIYITDNKELLAPLAQKDVIIEIPNNGPLTALLAIVPLQMIAYYVGIHQ